MSTETPVRLQFYFDPLCPFAWLTSLWIREVRQHRPIEVTWRFFSLAGPEDPDDPWHGPLRIAALARREGGNDAVDRAYLALGRLFHEQPDSFNEIERLADVAQPYLTELGLDPSLAPRALEDLSTTEDVLREHRQAMTAMGTFGVPWLVLAGDRAGFFGPVIGRLIQGEDAVSLWDDFVRMSARPYLYELKRGRKGLERLHGLSEHFIDIPASN